MPDHSCCRALLRCALALMAAMLSGGQVVAQGSGYPNKAVRIVVTSGAGGSSDLNARLIAAKFTAMWGQPIIVENKPGGNFVIGTEFVARSPADGYTLLVTITTLAQHPATRKNLPYDTFKDIAPITQLHIQRLLFVADARLPVSTLGEFLQLARTHPGKYNYASYGNITTAHLLLAKLNHDMRTDIVHVPYQGTPAAVRAILAGDAAVGSVDLTNARPHIASGKLKVLAATGPKRPLHSPDVPTFEESGVKGFGVDIWAGLFAPGGTPEPVLDKIAADFAKMLEQPDVQEWYRNAGVEPVSNTPAQFRAILKRDVDYWGDIVRSTGIKLD